MAATDFATASASPRSGSIIALVVDKLVGACGLVPYALVALGLRLVMARAVFLPGQTRIEGPVFSFDWVPGYGFSFILPAAIKAATVQMFEAQYANLPIPPALAAPLFTYAEFVLPICLVFGFATRFAALALILMTGFIAVYVTPEALWTVYAYWLAILLVLMTLGPGAVSIDALIRTIYKKQ